MEWTEQKREPAAASASVEAEEQRPERPAAEEPEKAPSPAIFCPQCGELGIHPGLDAVQIFYVIHLRPPHRRRPVTVGSSPPASRHRRIVRINGSV